MHTESKGPSIEVLCGLFGKQRQTFYKKKKSTTLNAFQSEIILQLIAKERKLMPRLGGRKLYYKIGPRLSTDFGLGRDKFFTFLRDNNLLVKRKRYRAITTMSSHWLRKYPNLTKDIVPNKPNQLWVSDITYLESLEGFIYLFLITDAYSRKIVGWSLANNLGSVNAIKALQMAISQLPIEETNLIHHSDRGVQYCSGKYVKLLNKHRVEISMTENGNPLENAVAERINGIIKTEWINEIKLKSLKSAMFHVRNIIDIYNCKRPHSSIGMLTPDQAHLGIGPLKRLWKNYYKRREEECYT